jgi:multidrug efflux pump
VMFQAYKTPALAGVFSTYEINVPQLFVDVDRAKAKREGVALRDVFETLQANLGSEYVNDFNKFGRTYQVIAQADASHRATPEDITQLQVRNASGAMVPIGTIATVQHSYGPGLLAHYNGFPAADLTGGAAPGFSSGEAQAAIAKIATEVLPHGVGFEWTDLAYQQIVAGNTAALIFPLSVLLAFLVLAAQYESWTLPLAVILIVPMSILCALIGVLLTHGDKNVFVEVGLVVLLGLACKNAILIVQFAHERQVSAGADRVTAALDAARLRLRPILMTSFAFIMGVVPLVFASGAGAEMRHAMGVAVFSGMLGVSFFGLFLTPVFFVTIRAIAERFTSPVATTRVPDTVTPAIAHSQMGDA